MRPLQKRKKYFIVKHFNDPDLSKNQIARLMKVCKSTVYRTFEKYGNCKPCDWQLPKQPGRKKCNPTDEERAKIVQYRAEYKCNSNTLQLLLKEKENMDLAHNQIYAVLKVNGLIRMQKPKHKRNSWVRFERKHSLSMVQGDWKRLKNGNWLIAFKDDASRLIFAYGEFPEATAEHSIEVLAKGIRQWGRPKQVLTGHDVQFFASDKQGKASGKNRFQVFLEANGIEHVLARVKHPQTCGKIERFFGEVERRLYTWKDFQTVDEVVDWYNNLLPSMSLNYEALETPILAFKRKMHHKQKIIKDVIEV